MQIYLNNTDILMTPDSVQIMKAPREGPCTMNGDVKALCSPRGSSRGLPVVMAELSFLEFAPPLGCRHHLRNLFSLLLISTRKRSISLEGRGFLLSVSERLSPRTGGLVISPVTQLCLGHRRWASLDLRLHDIFQEVTEKTSLPRKGCSLPRVFVTKNI